MPKTTPSNEIGSLPASSKRRQAEWTALSHLLKALRTAETDRQLFPSHKSEIRQMIAETEDMMAEHNSWVECLDFGQDVPPEAGL